MTREQAIIVLELKHNNPSHKQIKRAYRKKALQTHPDKPWGDAEKFKIVKAAFDLLTGKTKQRRRVVQQYQYVYTGICYWTCSASTTTYTS